MNEPRKERPTNTIKPAAMRTCRSTEIVFLPHDWQTAFDAGQGPPSTWTMLVKPAARNFARCPAAAAERQMT